MLQLATLVAHIQSILLLKTNLETVNWLKIMWALALLIWGMSLLQQAYRLFSQLYMGKK